MVCAKDTAKMMVNTILQLRIVFKETMRELPNLGGDIFECAKSVLEDAQSLATEISTDLPLCIATNLI